MMNALEEFGFNGCVPAIEEITLFTAETALALRLRANRISYDPVVNTAAYLFHDSIGCPVRQLTLRPLC